MAATTLCEHCGVTVFPELSETFVGKDVDGYWEVFASLCPACEKLTLMLLLKPERHTKTIDVAHMVRLAPKPIST